jgi:hypothetical protein
MGGSLKWQAGTETVYSTSGEGSPALARRTSASESEGYTQASELIVTPWLLDEEMTGRCGCGINILIDPSVTVRMMINGVDVSCLGSV